MAGGETRSWMMEGCRRWDLRLPSDHAERGRGRPPNRATAMAVGSRTAAPRSPPIHLSENWQRGCLHPLFLLPPLRAYAARALWSHVIASAAAMMQPQAVSRVSTVVDMDLSERSYLIYISPGLLDKPKLLQSPPTHVIGKRAQQRQEAVYAAGRVPLPKDQAKWSKEVAECGRSLNPIPSVPSPT